MSSAVPLHDIQVIGNASDSLLDQRFSTGSHNEIYRRVSEKYDVIFTCCSRDRRVKLNYREREGV